MSKVVKSVLTSLVGVAIGGIVGAGAASKIFGGTIAKKQKLSDKHLELFLMMNQWVKVKQEGKNLSSYFENNGYKKIAIYGMSYAGETLLEELKGTNTQVVYGIDQKCERLYAEVDIVSANDVLEDVDVIVVTAITFFEEIEEKIREKVTCPIVSLVDVLYEV